MDPGAEATKRCAAHAEPHTGGRLFSREWCTGSPTGRATVMALHMNRPLALVIREEEALRGRHPPQTHR